MAYGVIREERNDDHKIERQTTNNKASKVIEREERMMQREA